jgi:hypothetical protein
LCKHTKINVPSGKGTADAFRLIFVESITLRNPFIADTILILSIIAAVDIEKPKVRR